MKIAKTPHPTPHTPHPAPRKTFFSRPYLKNLGVVQTIQKQVAVTYRGQAYHIMQSLASLPTERPSLSF
ncbi:hypothetical protein PN482_09765 [Microcystis aeruginosa CS-555/01A07]|uniref:hypothetical protein n=1 Tax=Microcystis aeruginosa TaxID=1126 RepID=UPI00233130F8|nr:hypothetical protein [Microcystis aeruginosa]MDB9429176.1 hypothetical protein [Microcystis aeruginosa CS-555/01A07]